MHPRLTHILAASAALFISASATLAQDSKPSAIAATAETHARAVVSIKMSLKYEGSFGEHEQEREVTGVIIGTLTAVLALSLVVTACGKTDGTRACIPGAAT